jgi:tripartite-type tricarboxylate transporter receptor subunit TctC
MRIAISLAIIGAAACVAFGAAPASAQGADDFFKGRQIEFISAGEAGTTFDTWSRLLARYMPKYIPGAPNIIVRNMPGSGHIKAAGYIFEIAPKDGTTIGTFSNSIVSGHILKLPGLEFDSTSFSWIGSPVSSSRICVAMQGARVQKAEDLFETEFDVGGTGATGGISGTPTLLGRLLGMKFKVIEGYKGPVEILLAMERRELDGICSTIETFANRPGELESGKLKLLFNMEREPLPGFNAPTIYKFTKTDEQAAIIAFYNSNLELGQPILAPPGVPAARMAVLREAFASAMKDAGLIADAEKGRLQVKPVLADLLSQRVAAMAKTPADIVQKTGRLLGMDTGRAR